LASSQVQQDPFRTGGAGEQVGQLAVDPVQQGGAQQQALHLRWLPVQHLSHQVLRDGPVAAGELGDEPFGVRVSGEGQDGQPQPGRPAFGAVVQRGDDRVGQRDPGGGQQLAGLVLGEAQLRGTDLDQLPGQPQPVQAQRRVAAGGQDRVYARGEARQQRRELLSGLGGAELVQVVDDQDERAAGRGELGAHLVQHGLAVEPGRGGRRLGAAGRGADRAQQGEPEQLRVALVGAHGQQRDPAVLAGPVGPGVQQRRLTAAGGRRNDRDLFQDRPIQRRDQVVAVDQPLLPHARAGTRGRHTGHSAIVSGHLVSVSPRRSLVDHLNPVTTSHCPRQ